MSQLKKLTAVAAACLGLALSVTSFAASDLTEELRERIKPVGEVCMEGSECAAAPVAAGGGEPRSGADVYTTKCSACHGTGAAGAPKLGSAGDWAPRVGKGLDTLYSNAINGFNGMPAKGLCMDCSDDEIKAAVDHMVEGSK